MDALWYTLGVFGLILLLARLKVPLAGAIGIGAVTAGVAFGMGAGEVARTVATSLIQPRTIALVVITVQLLGLSALMQSAGQLERIVVLARAMLRRPAAAMVAMPALIGLLPMPGGAVFSAPMVAAAAEGGKADGSFLSAVNYWFRHIWEHWWFLYPGVMLAMSFTDGGYGWFALCQLPLGLFMAASGLLLFRGSHASLHVKADPAPPGTRRKFFWAISSIWIIVLVWVPVKLLLTYWLLPRYAGGRTIEGINYVPVAVGLTVSLAWTTIFNHLGGRQVARTLTSRKVILFAVLVISVMCFQYVLEQAGAAEKIGAGLREQGVPLVLLVAALPFISGLVTGLAVGFVGTSFPIVMGVVAAMPDPGPIRAYLALAYAMGHLGQMTSPLHLCQIVSNKYFNTSFAPVYRRIAPSILLTAALGAGYFVLLRMLL